MNFNPLQEKYENLVRTVITNNTSTEIFILINLLITFDINGIKPVKGFVDS